MRRYLGNYLELCIAALDEQFLDTVNLVPVVWEAVSYRMICQTRTV